MDDNKLFVRAIFYIDAMSNGINPTTGEYVPEGDRPAEPKIQRCMEYVLQLLERLRSTAG